MGGMMDTFLLVFSSVACGGFAGLIYGIYLGEVRTLQSINAFLAELNKRSDGGLASLLMEVINKE
jgi:hypothetical protein